MVVVICYVSLYLLHHDVLHALCISSAARAPAGAAAAPRYACVLRERWRRVSVLGPAVRRRCPPARPGPAPGVRSPVHARAGTGGVSAGERPPPGAAYQLLPAYYHTLLKRPNIYFERESELFAR